MSTNVLLACISASAAICVAVLAALSAYFATKRERRRVVYSEAIKAATAWHELLYRVRRRHKEQEVELVALFHDLQDQLRFHQAWVGSESKYMKRSYDRLVRETKSRTETLIAKAWTEPVRVAPGNALPEDKHPKINDLTDAFLRDVRSHLSPIFPRKLAVAWRNREKS